MKYKTANRTVREIVDGTDTPITWRKIVHVSEEASKYINEAFKEYALKAFFLASKDGKLCFHYLPASDRPKRKSEKVVSREVFKGPPASSRDQWRACGFVVNVANGYVWLKDRSKIVPVKLCSEPHDGPNDPPREHYSEKVRVGDRCKRKKGCKGHVVEQKDFPIKKLIIDRIQDITHEDNTPFDFSKSLMEVKQNRTKLQGLVVEKANTIRSNVSFNVNRGSKSSSEDQMIQTKPTSLKTVKQRYELSSKKPNFVSVAALTEEDKEKIEDYWTYLDEEYAEALTKDY